MTIPVQITLRHMASSPAVETRVRELANHLGTFSDRIQGCRVVVDSPHRHQHQGKVFNVKVGNLWQRIQSLVGGRCAADNPRIARCARSHR